MTLTLDIAPTQDTASREKRLKAARALYEAEMVSQEQAAEMSGLSLPKFLSVLQGYDDSHSTPSAEDASAEADRFRRWADSHSSRRAPVIPLDALNREHIYEERG